MTIQSGIDDKLQALREYAKSAGYAISSETDIPSGKQVRISDGKHQIPVSIYATGKILIQGKAGALRDSLESWRQGLLAGTSTFATEEQKRPADGMSRIGGRTGKFFVAPELFESTREMLAAFGCQISTETPDPNLRRLVTIT